MELPFYLDPLPDLTGRLWDCGFLQSLPILPAGLGFAGGAMAYVAINELLPESLEDTKSLPSTVSATSLAFMVFLTIQLVLSGSL
jgi:zinc transporter, ZIP family